LTIFKTVFRLLTGPLLPSMLPLAAQNSAEYNYGEEGFPEGDIDARTD
jgi:hypothetical protein